MDLLAAHNLIAELRETVAQSARLLAACITEKEASEMIRTLSEQENATLAQQFREAMAQKRAAEQRSTELEQQLEQMEQQLAGVPAEEGVPPPLFGGGKRKGRKSSKKRKTKRRKSSKKRKNN